MKTENNSTHVKKVCVVFRPEHRDTADKIADYFAQSEIPVTINEVSRETVMDVSSEQQLIQEIRTSDFIVPILSPKQQKATDYNATRHIFEMIGRMESDNEVDVFPVYHPQNGLEALTDNDLRQPIAFFKNVSSYFWNDGLSPDENKDLLTQQINRYINFKREVAQQIAEKKEKVISTTSDFTGPTIADLIKRERNLKYISYAWGLGGFACLIIGIGIAIFFAGKAFDTRDAMKWDVMTVLAAKNILIIVLLIAAARYSFMFSKTFMNESLKNSDRIHAIRFGEVYLRLFEKEIKFDEFKEVFELWNTKGDGYFLTIKSEDFDPDLLSKISELLKHKKS